MILLTIFLMILNLSLGLYFNEKKNNGMAGLNYFATGMSFAHLLYLILNK